MELRIFFFNLLFGFWVYSLSLIFIRVNKIFLIFLFDRNKFVLFNVDEIYCNFLLVLFFWNKDIL